MNTERDYERDYQATLPQGRTAADGCKPRHGRDDRKRERSFSGLSPLFALGQLNTPPYTGVLTGGKTAGFTAGSVYRRFYRRFGLPPVLPPVLPAWFFGWGFGFLVATPLHTAFILY